MSEHSREMVNWQKGRQLLEKITEKWPVKVLSVAAAIILFMFHHLGNLQERIFSSPLQIEVSNNLVPSSSYPRNVRITLKGDAASIYPVVEEDVEAYLDLTVYRDPGSAKVPVQIRRKGTAMEAENLEIMVEPLEVAVELDTRTSKYVPVAPNLSGSPERGYELVSYILEPNQMVIDGPGNLISGIMELGTDSIDLQNRNADFVLRLKVVNPNPLLVIRGDGMAEFRGFIRESIMIRSFDRVPISVTGLSGDFLAELETELGSVRLEGALRLIEVFEPGENMLFVDASEITEPGVYVLPVQALVPEAFTGSRQEPLEVTARITVNAEKAGP